MTEARPNVELQTSAGNIVVELYWDHAPNACTNFSQLASRGFYDTTKFHRIIKVRMYIIIIREYNTDYRD